MNTINVENCKTLLIGRRGENEVTTVAFDFTEWATEFGSGVVDLYVKRFGDDSAYPVVLTIDGTVASWLVTETDTNVAGYGKAEYVYRVDGKIAKSAVFPFFVAEDIGQPASEPPDPYDSWLEQLTALGAETEAHAQAAEQSAENAAQSAEDAAESAASAESYAGQAETAAGLAQAAQTASEAARDAAQTAQASAESSATAASGSAASAASSATAAAGSASDASASATAAGASASAASASATTASNAATAAQAAQSAAEDAAEDAQQAAQQAHVEYEQLSGEVDDLSDEVSQQKSAIEALDSLVDRKAGMLVDTASGAIASFVPDSTVPNLLGVTVDIEPVQDLHGYDNPWPAGGGVNKLSSDNMSRFTQKNYGVQYTVQADGGIAAAGTVTTTTWNYAQFYATLDDFGLSVGDTVALSCFGDNVNFAIHFYADNTMIRGIDATGTPVGVIPEGTNRLRMLVYCKASSAPTVGEVINKTIYPQLEKASTPSTIWHPYSNECPISGWDAVVVNATGINIWDEEWEVGGILNGVNAEARLRIRSANYIPVKGGKTLYFCFADGVYSSGSWFSIAEYGRDKSYLRTISPNKNTVVTIADDVFYIRFNLSDSWGGAEYTGGISINYPSTDHAYHHYSGNTYTIQLGQTVYGGTLDVTNGTNESAFGIVDLGTLTWTYRGNGVFTSVGVRGYCKPGSDICYCSAYKGVSAAYFANLGDKCIQCGNSYYATGAINIKDTAYSDAAIFKAAMSGVMLCYELATPIVIDLDPVQIATIAGQPNNVWADAGDVDVTYAADIKAYIDRMNQPAEDDMIANSLIASGKYFTVNNRLFISTASIAAGAMIIPGTNCQETSLAAALNALNT